MVAQCIHRSDCRLCNSTDLANVFSLTPTPPANELVESVGAAITQDTFPLDLYFCRNCHHLQLLDVVNPERLFRNYLYVSGTSASFCKHFEDYAEAIVQNYKIAPNSLVLDIGSNDGTLLGAFKKLGMRVQGVDPAEKIAAEATRNGINTIADFFTPQLAKKLHDQIGTASVVVANNVFAHIDDLQSILLGISEILDEHGIFVIEVSYLLDVLEKTLFDTIYHEHLDYHSVGPLQTFFVKFGFQLIHVERVTSHGGSLRLVVQKNTGNRPVNKSVAEAINIEADQGLYLEQTFINFQAKIDQLGKELRSVLTGLKQQGKHIAGFGLPAKATTLMHQFAIDRNFIDYVVDDNPYKQGLFSPGFGVPIVNNDHLKNHTPDCIVVLAWNFATPIISKLDWFIAAGGKVIVPLPELLIVEKS